MGDKSTKRTKAVVKPALPEWCHSMITELIPLSEPPAGSVTVADLVSATGSSHDAARKALDRLVAAGKLACIKVRTVVGQRATVHYAKPEAVKAWEKAQSAKYADRIDRQQRQRGRV